MLGRYVGRRIAQEGSTAAFAAVAPELRKADITIGNLECVLSDKPFTESKRVRLRGNPSLAPTLADAGFDVLSVANNHALDAGTAGLTDTLAALASAHIAAVGVRPEPVIVERQGLKVAFLAYCDFPGNPGISFTDESRLSEQIAAAHKGADIVVVSWHWGNELSMKVSLRQEHLAKLAANAGADLVLGHHPHVLQSIAWVNGKDGHRSLVAYSLGNFVFDGRTDSERTSEILHVEIDKSGVKGYRVTPMRIENGFPRGL